MKKTILFLSFIATALFSSCSKDEEVATADPIQQQLISEILSAGNSMTNSFTASNSNLTPTVQLKSASATPELPTFDIDNVVNSPYSGKITITGTMTVNVNSANNAINVNLILKEVFGDYVFKVNDASYKANGTINYATTFTSSGNGTGTYNSTISGSINITGPNYNKSTTLQLAVVADANNKGTVTGTIDGVKISYSK